MLDKALLFYLGAFFCEIRDKNYHVSHVMS